MGDASAGRRLLVLDEDGADRALTARLLDGAIAGAEIAQVTTALAFAEHMADGDFCAVIAERALSWADGVDVLDAVKRRYPDRPAVLFTAAAIDDVAGAGLRLRFDGYVRKGSAGWLQLPTLVLDLLNAVPPARADAPGAGAAAGAGAASAPAAPPPDDAGARTVDLFDALAAADGSDAGAPPSPGTPAAGPVNLESALLDAMVALKDTLRATGARVRSGPLPTLALRRADAVELFARLLRNAIEHRSAQPPLVTVHAQDRGTYWLLAVRDNGTGIQPRDLGEVLYRIAGVADDDAAQQRGLAVCRRIAQRYRGDVWLHSQPGRGTTVFVALAVEELATPSLELTVQYDGGFVGRIRVASLSNKQLIAGAAMALPELRARLGSKSIRDVLWVDTDVVRVVA